MKTPITSCPASLRRAAATEESTPPLMATRIFVELITSSYDSPRGSGCPDPPSNPEPAIWTMHDNLWAPWRMTYLRELERRRREVGEEVPALEDFISHAWEHPEEDEAAFVVHRGEHGLLMLNRFPYANGHLLVALGTARPRLLDHTAEERASLWSLVDFATDLVERAFEPHGVNIGVNQGDAAGAGLPQHLHVHVVPRWSGDLNFMSSVAGVRVVPDSLEEVAARYRAVIADSSDS
ncbi:MAG: HIT family hydrolase [Phycisphaerae bacterium]|nr:HIT family hydrolase [Phycisphaerae bacterium]